MASMPTNSPVTLEQVKSHLRVTHDIDNEDIVLYASAAIEFAEVYAQRAFRQRTFTHTLSDFPGSDGGVELPWSPLVSVDAIAYYDSDNAAQTLDEQTIITASDGSAVACIYPAYDDEWPDTAARQDAITITYTAGYGSVAAVPVRAKQAILLLTQHSYDNHAPVIVGTIASELPMAVGSLLRSLKPGNYVNP